MGVAGDGFVVMRTDWMLWDGEAWVADAAGARVFREGADAYADCALAVSCLRRLGHRCNVAYLPGRGVRAVAEVEVVQLPSGGAV